jgi:hypothetical protein
MIPVGETNFSPDLWKETVYIGKVEASLLGGLVGGFEGLNTS